MAIVQVFNNYESTKSYCILQISKCCSLSNHQTKDSSKSKLNSRNLGHQRDSNQTNNLMSINHMRYT